MGSLLLFCTRRKKIKNWVIFFPKELKIAHLGAKKHPLVKSGQIFLKILTRFLNYPARFPYFATYGKPIYSPWVGHDTKVCGKNDCSNYLLMVNGGIGNIIPIYTIKSLFEI